MSKNDVTRPTTWEDTVEKSKKKSRVWKKVLKVAQVGSELAEVVVHLKGTPTILGGLAVASRVVATYDKLQKDPSPFDEWSYVDLDDLVSSFGPLIEDRIEVGEKNQTHFTTELYGTKIGWQEGQDYSAGVWYEDVTKTREDIKRIIAKLLWERLGPGLLITESSNDVTTITSDPISGSVPSGMADELYQELSGFLKKGYPRSALLYGEPGTGKSHIVRQVAHRAGKFYIRLNARRMPQGSYFTLLLKMLCPSAVLIDDIDRAADPEGLLESISSVLSSVSLLLATANDIDRMDRASLRPGRFDTVLEVVSLDEGVLGAILRQLPESIRSEARKLPIAYIEELRKIVEVVGPDKAIQSMTELKKRFDTIRGPTEEEDQKK